MATEPMNTNMKRVLHDLVAAYEAGSVDTPVDANTAAELGSSASAMVSLEKRRLVKRVSTDNRPILWRLTLGTLAYVRRGIEPGA